MFQCFKISFQRLSESYYCALYVFHNDLGFWNSPNHYTKNFSIATQKFSIKDSVFYGFGRIYSRNPQWKTSFLCSDFCSKKKVLSKKASWVQSWRLPNVTYWTFLELLRFIFKLRFSKWLQSYKKSNYWSLKSTGTSYKKKFYTQSISGRNRWNNVEKIVQAQTTLISAST